jgi:aconitate hydratase
MGTIVPAISGPKRPQDYVALTNAKQAFAKEMEETFKRPLGKEVAVKGEDYSMSSGKVVIASITSCTNTSNPYVMIGAGLVARKAAALGLNRKPWVKTSLAPGSQVVSAYLEAADLQKDLDSVGFNLVGYGCTTCIGNSGPIQSELSEAISEGDLVATAVLSGNRNFEGRISPDVRANYLASPPLVVAYAIAGTMDINLASDAIGTDKEGNDVYLKDIWPTTQEVAEMVEKTVTREAFLSKYANVFEGDEKWQSVNTTEAKTYDWPAASTYVQNPPYFQGMSKEPGVISDVKDAKVLAILGDMITTDHISPAGGFAESTPAGQYLTDRQVPVREFNSYGSRRGNHEIMMRGTFANIRIKNEMLDNVEGGYTKGPDGSKTSIYDAAMAYKKAGIPLVIFGGEQYGAGSSRDWAAKGTNLLGISAVIAESFERIHRSNLVGMGVIPFEFTNGDTRKSLGLTGSETVSIGELEGDIKPQSLVPCNITFPNGDVKEITLKSRIDTAVEIEYLEHGGVLHYVLRNLAKAS